MNDDDDDDEEDEEDYRYFNCPFIQNPTLTEKYYLAMLNVTYLVKLFSQKEKLNFSVFSTCEFDEHILRIKHLKCCMRTGILCYFAFENIGMFSHVEIFYNLFEYLKKQDIKVSKDDHSIYTIDINNVSVSVGILSTYYKPLANERLFYFNEKLKCMILYWNHFNYQEDKREEHENWRRDCYFNEFPQFGKTISNTISRHVLNNHKNLRPQKFYNVIYDFLMFSHDIDGLNYLSDNLSMLIKYIIDSESSTTIPLLYSLYANNKY